MHGDDDQVVPIADSALLGIKLLKHGTLKVYKGAPARRVREPPRNHQSGSAGVHSRLIVRIATGHGAD
jgi:hypothetical protein